uniref:Uncharacterized protein n=1 Tax=Cacopsylla melanoneura TaxID=428564 RepID=A0A8D8U761_9HEMI
MGFVGPPSVAVESWIVFSKSFCSDNELGLRTSPPLMSTPSHPAPTASLPHSLLNRGNKLSMKEEGRMKQSLVTMMSNWFLWHSFRVSTHGLKSSPSDVGLIQTPQWMA